jgi:hypothetical protein
LVICLEAGKARRVELLDFLDFGDLDYRSPQRVEDVLLRLRIRTLFGSERDPVKQ